MGMLRLEDKELILKCVSRLNEQTAFEKLREYVHHYNTSTYYHSIGVAHMSLWLVRALHIKCHEEQLIYGALLHDYYLYDCHSGERSFHLFKHAKVSLENAKRDWKLTKRQENMIKCHMFPLTFVPPRYKESVIVNIADKICALYECMHQKPYHNYILNEDKIELLIS